MRQPDSVSLPSVPDSYATYDALLADALADPRQFWGAQAALIDWQTPYRQVLDDSDAPAARWYEGGRTNLCHNAVDRHLRDRSQQTALIAVSGETGQEQVLTYRALYDEVNAMAAAMRGLGVGEGDRVLIYLPMIAEAAIAMLACARIGAIHVVVFGGFAAASLAARIDDAAPALLICADAGFQSGRAVPYKAWVDDALAQAAYRCPVVVVDRGILPYRTETGRDFAYGALRREYADAILPCVWRESSAPSYVLYTSGTTGAPKGVQRDTGGYAVALMTSMTLLFQAKAGETFFATSDLGWVVGHSYGVYGPLLMGMCSVLYEGQATQPDPGVWWRLVAHYRVGLMLSSATAMRLLKRHGASHFQRQALPTLRTLFLAGEPLDEPTSAWVEAALACPVVDHYWQTESGTPMIATPIFETDADRTRRRKCGSPGRAAPGYRLRVIDETTGMPCAPGEQGLLIAEGHLPPGCFTTLWRRDDDYRRLYWRKHASWAYQTFDWAVVDADGDLRLLGRSDDVINVSGKRLGTREIEAVLLADNAVAEVAVVGIAHALRGQAPVAFVVLQLGALEAAGSTDGGRAADNAVTEAAAVIARLRASAVRCIGSHARPWRIVCVPALPRTRSGKLLRRVLKSVMEGRTAEEMNVPELQAVIGDLARAFAEQRGALLTSSA
ncbi:AMP-binding protein [Robbsia sp. KACC 23696]|uniref:AMP-binding protein n=1 Tax=Robbsia sp. KACC 23696 TaxID=3149231 RepID=UPI00325BE46B